MNWQPLAATTTTTSSSSQTASGFGPGAKPASTTDPLTSKDTFLKLLIAQMQNQNPLQPADGVEFLSQLTQISGLEQSIEMRQSLDTVQKTLGDILDVQKQIQKNTLPPDPKSSTASGAPATAAGANSR